MKGGIFDLSIFLFLITSVAFFNQLSLNRVLFNIFILPVSHLPYIFLQKIRPRKKENL